jgi:fermentation-respiration switch protein FrsA (DUF1100 family)
MKSLLALLALLAACYGALLALMYVFQSRLLYLPDIAGAGLATTPASIGLDFETVRLTAADGVRLHGWYLSAPRARRVVLFCHGNAGNVSHRLDSLRIFHELGLAVLIFDYRGYGESEGRPSEAGTYADAQAAWRWLREERGYRPDEIVLFGRSMGAAVAAELATRVEPAAVILESAFTSVPDLAARFYWYVPVRWLARLHYPTLDRVTGIEAPLLVVHSRDDEIVPFEHGVAIHARANPPKSLLEIEGDHNTGFLISAARYRDGLGAFIDSLSPP